MIESITFTTRPGAPSGSRYIEVFDPRGKYVSRHRNVEECTESITRYAVANQLGGQYEIRTPNKVVDVSIALLSSRAGVVTGLPLDANGFTDLNRMVTTNGLYDNARIIYLDPTLGNDSTAGPNGDTTDHYDKTSFANVFEAAAPNAYATLLPARQSMRAGFPDVLLIKRGETFTDQLRLVTDAIGGVSNAERQIIAAYGTSGARPSFTGGQPIRAVHFQDPPNMRNLIIADMKLIASTQGSSQGFYFLAVEMSNFLIENCYLTLFEKGSVHQGVAGGGESGTMNSPVVRRCVYYRNGSSGTNEQGLSMSDVITPLVEENVFYQNGWDGLDDDTKDDQSRHLYIQTGVINATVKRNVTSESASSGGLQLRDGGTLDENLCLSEPTALSHSRGNNPAVPPPPGSIDNNVVLGRSVGAFGGFGIELGGNRDGFTMSSNILAHNDTETAGSCMRVRANASNAPVSNVTIDGNYVYNFNDFLVDNPDFLTNLTFSNNKIFSDAASLTLLIDFEGVDDIISSGNEFESVGAETGWFNAPGSVNLAGYKTAFTPDDTTSILWASPVAPATLSDYMTDRGISGSTHTAFMEASILQSKWVWNADLMAQPAIDYIRASIGWDPI